MSIFGCAKVYGSQRAEDSRESVQAGCSHNVHTLVVPCSLASGSADGPMLPADMTVQRMDNVLVVVED
ncbi:MAG TPA: hypothetical protein VHN37_05975, partial [Actinomycetota bacterium]|nr:hypothetical protein [Actinomycetota bacterium]